MTPPLLQRRGRLLATGAVLLSIPTAFDLIAFSDVLTSFLTQLLGALITLLLGGDVSRFVDGASTLF